MRPSKDHVTLSATHWKQQCPRATARDAQNACISVPSFLRDRCTCLCVQDLLCERLGPPRPER